MELIKDLKWRYATKKFNTEKKIREQLKPHSWGQSQITDASHLFVFCIMVIL